MTTLAYCYASGHIEFGSKCPGGALPLVRGPDQEVRDFIAGVARLAYDNETWLVPGVPEAEDQEKAMDALLRFEAWITPSARKHGLRGGARKP